MSDSRHSDYEERLERAIQTHYDRIAQMAEADRLACHGPQWFDELAARRARKVERAAVTHIYAYRNGNVECVSPIRPPIPPPKDPGAA